MLRATLHAEGADVANTLSACAELAALVTPECEKAHPEVPALVAACRGAAELWRGDLDAAEQTLAEAADRAAACGARLLRVQCLGRLALLYALRGRYRRAEELGHDTHRLALQGEVGPERHPPAAAIALAWSFTQQYRYAQARHWLEYAERCAIENQRLLLAPVAAVLRSRLGPAGEPTAAIEAMLTQDRVVPVSWMRDLLTAQAVEVELAEGRTDLARGTAAGFTESNSIRIRLAQNRVHAARTPAPPPREALDGTGVPLDLRVDAWLAECAFQLDRGRDDSAVRAYERALELAAPEQLRRPFVHPPPRIRELVCGRVSDEAMSWLRLSPRKRTPGVAEERRPESAEQPVPPQPLTMRETEVLRHLAHMLSTQEIGLAMFVSINTVRTHIRSILRKLDVPGRSAAVRRGWELGLISRPD
jgi:LuxR family maltose regulon positive regulatory protein